MKAILKNTALSYLWLIVATFGCMLLSDIRSLPPYIEMFMKYAAFMSFWAMFIGSAIMVIVGYFAFFLQCPFTRISGWMMALSHVLLLLCALAIKSKAGQLGMMG
jgi:hypothetical protein